MNQFFDLDLARGQPSLTKKQIRRLRKHCLRRAYSANLAVDLGGTTQSYPSLTFSGMCFVQSGPLVVGNGVDMLHSDTFCNLSFGGLSIFTSGQLRIQVQDSDTDTSGNYTDPTSGLAQFPTYFESGGIVRLNSGGLLGGTIQGAINTIGSTSGNINSGYAIQSGFDNFAGFQRQHRFVRALVMSGTNDFYAGPLVVGFVSQYKQTGSGGGFSYLPGSGVINV